MNTISMTPSAVLLLALISPLFGDNLLKVNPNDRKQEFQGMGCGAIFYEAHMTSFQERGKAELQEGLYNDLFQKVRTEYLQLMIRPDHEPANDNADPYLPQYKPEWFAYADHTLAICKAARLRIPTIQFYATLYTPPAWMKTNHDVAAGGKERATILPGMENELAEYCWAFLAYMERGGCPVRFLSIANEPDWPHDQPGYNLEPAAYAKLLASVDRYFEKMAKTHPKVPRPELVGPNVLSAVSCAETWVPRADAEAPGALAVIGTHDYDRRGERFVPLRKLAGNRPLWVTEWCVNGKDESPGLINSAGEYWLAMTEAFNQGVNVWMAYDWVYPPRQGGEALVHVDWGNGYTKTKIYHGFRQWCAPLVPGMKVVGTKLTGTDATGISKPGLKAAAFVSADGTKLVVHVANVQDRATTMEIDPGTVFAKLKPHRWRTSPVEDDVEIESDGLSRIEILGRSMNTWVWGGE